MEITSFGLELRSIRASEGILLGDMAARLKVSSALLCSIERGKRTVSEEFLEKLFRVFNIDNLEKHRLSNIAKYNRKTKSVVTKSKEEAELVAAVVDVIKSLGPKDVNRLRKEIEKKYLGSFQGEVIENAGTIQ